MYYVYVLKSTLKAYFYTGCTDNLKNRFNQHNAGLVKSTKHYLPFTLVYYEACLNKEDSFKREKYLKSRLGKAYIRKRLKKWFESELL